MPVLPAPPPLPGLPSSRKEGLSDPKLSVPCERVIGVKVETASPDGGRVAVCRFCCFSPRTGSEGGRIDDD